MCLRCRAPSAIARAARANLEAVRLPGQIDCASLRCHASHLCHCHCSALLCSALRCSALLCLCPPQKPSVPWPPPGLPPRAPACVDRLQRHPWPVCASPSSSWSWSWSWWFVPATALVIGASALRSQPSPAPPHLHPPSTRRLRTASSSPPSGRARCHARRSTATPAPAPRWPSAPAAAPPPPTNRLRSALPQLSLTCAEAPRQHPPSTVPAACPLLPAACTASTQLSSPSARLPPNPTLPAIVCELLPPALLHACTPARPHARCCRAAVPGPPFVAISRQITLAPPPSLPRDSASVPSQPRLVPPSPSLFCIARH